MNKRWIMRYLTLLGIVAAMFAPARAVSQQKQLTTEQLTDRAEIVALGKVTTLNSEWINGGKKIQTRVTISVERYLKGEQSQQTLTVVVPGGEVGSTGETYSHVARFSSNEDVVVFAQRDARGELKVTAGEQGKINVRQDERTGRKLVGENELLEVFTSRVANAVRAQRDRQTR